MQRFGRLLTAVVLVVGCASETTPPGSGPDTGGHGDGIMWGPSDTVPDNASADAPVSDVPSADPDLIDGAGDPAWADAGLCLAEGGFGCPCDGPDDCLEGWCVDSPYGQVCTRTCLEECPQGWDCVQVDTGADPVFICLPRHLWICRPCTASTQCSEGLPPGEDRCVDLGAEGAFCGGACGADADCPAGFICTGMATVEGGFSQQCVLEDGVCGCSQKHTEAGSATYCLNQNEFGACDGERTCTPEGLSACEGPIPAQETCDDTDEDCDGETDEDVVSTECDVTGEFGVCVGTTQCVDGKETCVGEAAAPEDCNGLDDDCDGGTDEGFTDTDEDGLANCVDPDDDDDEILDDVDNCPLIYNPGQGDMDGDDLGDVCDEDSDGDGVPDENDCQPYDPEVPSCQNKDCGDDGCGGSCGQCLPGSECLNFHCTCVPDCAGKQCGDNGCGGSCGTCPPNYVCQDGACQCLPQCGGKECGADGCGGSCGSCPPGHLCQNGWCLCQPDCAGKQCGTDGCGGDCGTCQVGYTCNESGICENTQPNPCGTVDYAGLCAGNSLTYCHAPGNTSSPCYTPPNCELFQMDCDLLCISVGYSGGLCDCGNETICPPDAPWCCYCSCSS